MREGEGVAPAGGGHAGDGGVGHDGLAVGLLGAEVTSHVIAGAGEAGAVLSLAHVQAGPLLVAVAHVGTLQEDRDVRQLAGVVAGQVAPGLGALDGHGVGDLVDEGALLAKHHGAGDGGARRGRSDLVVDLGPVLAAVGWVDVGVVGVVLILRLASGVALGQVVEGGVGGGVGRDRHLGVVDVLGAVRRVLGQVLDGHVLRVVGVAAVLVGAHPLVALVAGDGLGVHGSGAVLVHHATVERDVDVGALAQHLLHVLVVPTRVEGDALGVGTVVLELGDLGVGVLVETIELVVVLNLGTCVVAVGVHGLADRVREGGAVLVVLGQAVDA